MMQMHDPSKKIFSLVALFLAAGCATAPPLSRDLSADVLYHAACQPGTDVKSAQGTVWFKTLSKDVSGQFSVDVEATAPDSLHLEVTNFLGGTEALITVKANHYEIKRDRLSSKTMREGNDSWGGIPLRWATDLFLGKIPCPLPGAKVSLSRDSDGQLKVITPSVQEEFLFQFRSHEGHPWPESLVWKRLDRPNVQVEFKFDDPEERTLSPKKWEARSSQGAVKVRWRDRKLVQN